MRHLTTKQLLQRCIVYSIHTNMSGNFDSRHSVSTALASRRNSELDGGNVTIHDATVRTLNALGAQGAPLLQSSKRYDLVNTALRGGGNNASPIQWTLSLFVDDVQQMLSYAYGNANAAAPLITLSATSAWDTLQFQHSRAMLWFPSPSRQYATVIPARCQWLIRTSAGDILHGAFDVQAMQGALIRAHERSIFTVPMYNRVATNHYVTRRLATSSLRLVLERVSDESFMLLEAGIELNLAPTVGDFVYPNTLSVNEALDNGTFAHHMNSISTTTGTVASTQQQQQQIACNQGETKTTANAAASNIFTSELRKREIAASLGEVIRSVFANSQVVEAAASFACENESIDFYIDTKGTGNIGVPPNDNSARPRFPQLVDMLYLDMLHQYIEDNMTALNSEVARLDGSANTKCFRQRNGVYTSVYGYEALYNVARKTTQSPLARALRAAYERAGYASPTLAQLMSDTSGLPVWLSRDPTRVFAELMSDTLAQQLTSLEAPSRSEERARFERLIADALATTTVPVFEPGTGSQKSALASALLQMVFETSSVALEKRARAVFNMPTATLRGSLLGEAVGRALMGDAALRTNAAETLCSVEAPMREAAAALRTLANRAVMYPTFVEDAASARVFVDSALRRAEATQRDRNIRIEATGPVTETVFVHASRVLPAGSVGHKFSPRALDHYSYAIGASDDGYLTMLLVDSLSGGTFALRTRRTAKALAAMNSELYDGLVRTLVSSTQLSALNIGQRSMHVLNTVTRYAIDIVQSESSAANNGTASGDTNDQRLDTLNALVDKHFVGVSLVSPFGVQLGDNATQTLTRVDATSLTLTVSQASGESHVLSVRYDRSYDNGKGSYRIIDGSEQGEWRNALEFAVVSQRMLSQAGEPLVEVPLFATLGSISVPKQLVAALVREQSVRLERAVKQSPGALASPAPMANTITDPFNDAKTVSELASSTYSPLLTRIEYVRNSVLCDPQRRAAAAGAQMVASNTVAANSGGESSSSSLIGPDVSVFHNRHNVRSSPAKRNIVDSVLSATFGLLHAPYHYYNEYAMNPLYTYGPVVYSSPYYGGYGARRYILPSRPLLPVRRFKKAVVARGASRQRK
jgi:hypothetical protein